LRVIGFLLSVLAPVDVGQWCAPASAHNHNFDPMALALAQLASTQVRRGSGETHNDFFIAFFPLARHRETSTDILRVVTFFSHLYRSPATQHTSNGPEKDES
jgi:hypothetical protein